MRGDLPPQNSLVTSVPSPRERADALALGMPGYWLVAPEYVVENNLLVGQGKPAAYLPVLRPMLVTELAKLHEGGVSSLLPFAHEWGLLGYRQLLLASRGSGMSLARRRQLPYTPTADPLPWIDAHARGIWTCLELMRYLDDNDMDGLAIFLRASRDDEGDPAIHAGMRLGTTVICHKGDAPADAIARWLVAQIVTPNLEGLHLSVASNGLLEPIQTFDALLDVAYWHLWGLIKQSVSRQREKTVEGGEQMPGLLTRCVECHALFVRTDRRQRFCPSPPDINGVVVESRCAKRARARRLRQGNP